MKYKRADNYSGLQFSIEVSFHNPWLSNMLIRHKFVRVLVKENLKANKIILDVMKILNYTRELFEKTVFDLN